MTPHASPPPTERPAQAPRRPTVLVCDDDRLVLLTLVAALRGAGYEVIEADNGDDAILLARQHRPDIALLDIRMDGKSGLDVASYLRDYVGTPFMFLSAFSDELFIRKAREFGALDYLVKPVDIEKIPPAVAAALQLARDAEGASQPRNGPVPAMPDASGERRGAPPVSAESAAAGAAQPAGPQAGPVAPEQAAHAEGAARSSAGAGRSPVAADSSTRGSAPVSGIFAADIPASDTGRPPQDAAIPTPKSVPGSDGYRDIALGIMMERFRLTFAGAQQRLAALARQTGRAETSIAEEFVRGIDALNAAGLRDPAA